MAGDIMMRRLAHFARDRKGAAAVELALVAPLLILLYFGTVDLANWYMAHRRLVVAASTVADLTTQNEAQVNKAYINDIWAEDGIGRVISPLQLNNVHMTMRDYRKQNGAVSQKWSYSANGGTACGASLSAADMAALGTSEMSDGNDVVVAAVCTTVAPMVLDLFGFEPIELKYRISMRPRMGKTLDCTDCPS
jgi:hypothetical protein